MLCVWCREVIHLLSVFHLSCSFYGFASGSVEQWSDNEGANELAQNDIWGKGILVIWIVFM